MNQFAGTLVGGWLTIEQIDLSYQDCDRDNASFIQFYYIIAGNAVLQMNGTKIALTPGSLTWLNQPPTCKCTTVHPLTGYCLKLYKPIQEAVSYDPELIYHTNFREFLLPVQYGHVSSDNADAINGIFKALQEEISNSHPFKEEMMQSYFKILLLLLMNQQKEHMAIKVEPDISLFQKFQHLLEKNFRAKKLVADYAGDLFITPGYLNAVTKRITGLSASHLIRQRIVLEAKRHVAYSNMCMKEIAADLGFADLPHFSKYFKSTVGISYSNFIQKTYFP